MVYTDMVPHAVLAGQYALEQTYLIAPEAMIAPEHSPLRVLQAMTDASLAWLESNAASAGGDE